LAARITAACSGVNGTKTPDSSSNSEPCVPEGAIVAIYITGTLQAQLLSDKPLIIGRNLSEITAKTAKQP
jgi:hypothetical protein